MGNAQAPSNDDDLDAEYAQMCDGYDAKTGCRSITAEEILPLMNDDKSLVYIIDTRGENEHLVSTLPGAHLVVPDIGVLSMSYKTPLPDPATIPSDVMVVCHCTAGLRSGWTAVDLEKKWQRPIYSLKGGIISWSNAGGKLVVPTSETEVDETSGAAVVETERVHTYSATWGKFLKKKSQAIY